MIACAVNSGGGGKVLPSRTSTSIVSGMSWSLSWTAGSSAMLLLPLCKSERGGAVASRRRRGSSGPRALQRVDGDHLTPEGEVGHRGERGIPGRDRGQDTNPAAELGDAARAGGVPDPEQEE